MTARLLFVRHGRTASNASGLLLGRADPPLDPTGRDQAARLAASLAAGVHGEVVRVVSSPLTRTRETAAAFGLPVHVDERFVELDYGELDGVALSDVPAATWDAWRRDVHFRPPGGETLAELGVRVRAACVELLAGLPERGTVVVVSHVSPIKAAAAWAMGVDDSVSWRMHLDPASVTTVLARGGRPVLSGFNLTAHLVSA